MSAPRRAHKRWLDGDCPRGVLAIFDNGGFGSETARKNGTADRYTVLYVPEPGQDFVEYLGASAHPSDPQGVGVHGELSLHEARAYRYAATQSRESMRWTDLPEDVKRAVRADLGVTL